ncbi:hypothetical protein ACHOLT_00400 [Desulfitobacterium sp. Sab5]|uniref:hypothetical protein n=1 Tax=Desulfitobacterium nosdiversum TaxID=3375356 RepID=UPI003CED50D6
MENVGIGIIGAFGSLGYVTTILEAVFYVSAIIVSFKAIQALDIYINKNTR